MKSITTALLFFIQTILVVAFSPIPFPADRLELSRASDHILLVEVTAIATETKEGDGLRATTYRVSGKVLEVIRGERPKNWSHTAADIEVTDMDATRKALGDDGTDLLPSGREFEREGSQCVAGGRYLVIYWRGHAFFVQVSKADPEWRRKIRPRETANQKEPNKSEVATPR